MSRTQPKRVIWMGSSRKDVKHFPEDVKDEIGHALWLAQCGEKHVTAKPLKGFGGATVLEIIADFDTDTYRAVYTVRFCGNGFRSPLLPEEGETRQRNAASGYGPH